MDKGSVVGSILMFVVCLVVFYKATHGHLEALWSEKGAIMVVGGTIAVVMMAIPMDQLKGVMKWVKRYFFHKGQSLTDVIQTLNQLSEKARREGILSLEAEVAKIEDPFLTSGLRMAIDGVAPESIGTRWARSSSTSSRSTARASR